MDTRDYGFYLLTSTLLNIVQTILIVVLLFNRV